MRKGGHGVVIKATWTWTGREHLFYVPTGMIDAAYDSFERKQGRGAIQTETVEYVSRKPKGMTHIEERL